MFHIQVIFPMFKKCIVSLFLLDDQLKIKFSKIVNSPSQTYEKIREK